MLLPMIGDDPVVLGLFSSFRFALQWSELEVNPSYDDAELDKTFPSNYQLHPPDLIFSLNRFLILFADNAL